MEGTVKFFNNEKAYGFIKGDDGQEVFVHKTGLSGNTKISENDRVSYEVEKGKKGLNATGVTLIK